MNYFAFSDSDYRELNGPVNDAEEIKNALLIGAGFRRALETCALNFIYPPRALFDYKEEGICFKLITGEEANQNTALWLSTANIVLAVSAGQLKLIHPRSSWISQMQALRDLVCDA